jgi:hypothetical protein
MMCEMDSIEFHTTIKDGIIKIPAKYRDQVKDRVRVILVPEESRSKRRNLIDQLLEKPVIVHDFHPIKRDDLHER